MNRPRPVWRAALAMTAEVMRLRGEVRDLRAALAKAHKDTEQARVTCSRIRRDAELLGLMARDRRVAVEILSTAHDIDRQEEVG